MRNADAQVLLASRSPRRRELLRQIGIAHEPVSVEVDESALPGESVEALARRLARAKAEAGWAASAGRLPVLGADTLVAVDGRPLGKPADRSEGLAMLSVLSGRVHRVLSAVVLVWDNRSEVRLSNSEVEFRALTPAEIEAYWDTGEPADKAGAYAIQGLAAGFVRRLAGSYSGVMGLPLFETCELLRLCGIDPLGPAARGERPETED
jgi:septum formation protein